MGSPHEHCGGQVVMGGRNENMGILGSGREEGVKMQWGVPGEWWGAGGMGVPTDQ